MSKALLDEHPDHRCAGTLAPREVFTASYLRWEGFKSGRLLEIRKILYTAGGGDLGGGLAGGGDGFGDGLLGGAPPVFGVLLGPAGFGRAEGRVLARCRGEDFAGLIHNDGAGSAGAYVDSKEGHVEGSRSGQWIF